MSMLNIFGIPGAVAPISSFIELVKSLRGNNEDEKEQSDVFVTDDNQEEQNKEE